MICQTPAEHRDKMASKLLDMHECENVTWQEPIANQHGHKGNDANRTTKGAFLLGACCCVWLVIEAALITGETWSFNFLHWATRPHWSREDFILRRVEGKKVTAKGFHVTRPHCWDKRDSDGNDKRCVKWSSGESVTEAHHDCEVRAIRMSLQSKLFFCFTVFFYIRVLLKLQRTDKNKINRTNQSATTNTTPFELHRKLTQEIN